MSSTLQRCDHGGSKDEQYRGYHGKTTIMTQLENLSGDTKSSRISNCSSRLVKLQFSIRGEKVLRMIFGRKYFRDKFERENISGTSCGRILGREPGSADDLHSLQPVLRLPVQCTLCWCCLCWCCLWCNAHCVHCSVS